MQTEKRQIIKLITSCQGVKSLNESGARCSTGDSANKHRVDP